MFTRLQSWVILTDHLDNYPVLLDGEKNSKKFQIFKKMQMKLGATQTEPYLALCHNESFYYWVCPEGKTDRELGSDT